MLTLEICSKVSIYLIFFIKFGLITISSDQDVRHPVRRLAHDRSDATDFRIFRTFDDKLIMDVSAYLLVWEIAHGIA